MSSNTKGRKKREMLRVQAKASSLAKSLRPKKGIRIHVGDLVVNETSFVIVLMKTNWRESVHAGTFFVDDTPFKELKLRDVWPLNSVSAPIPVKTPMVYLGAGIRPVSPDHVAFFLDGETVWANKDVLNTEHFKVIVRFRDCIVVDV